MASSSLDKFLPFDKARWFDAANKPQAALDKGLIALPLEKYQSASKISKSQYYLLRTLWSWQRAEKLELTDFVRPQLEASAKDWLKGYSPFQSYKAILEQRSRGRQVPYDGSGGVFDLVLYQQDQIQRISASRDLEAVPKLNISPRQIDTRSTTRRANDQTRIAQQTPSRSEKPRVFDANRAPRLTRGSNQRITSEDPFDTGDLREALPQIDKQGKSIGDFDTSSEGSSDGSQSRMASRISPFSPFDPALAQAANDEQIVNVGLTSLLAAITMYHLSDAVWTMERKSFRMRDLYEARTDGCLHHRSSANTLAILETKACVRLANPVDIMMQETAQMAAWIRSHPKSGVFMNAQARAKKHRLLISQDHEEIYLTIAEYDNEYERYLRETSKPEYMSANKSQSSSKQPNFEDSEGETGVNDGSPYRFYIDQRGPFMRMRCYGPWVIRDRRHMQDLAQKVVALTQLLITNAS